MLLFVALFFSVQVVCGSEIKLQGQISTQIVTEDKSFKISFDRSHVPDTYYNKTDGDKFSIIIGNCKLTFSTALCKDFRLLGPRHFYLKDTNKYAGQIHDKKFDIEVKEKQILFNLVDPANDKNPLVPKCEPQFDEKLLAGHQILNISLTGDVHPNLDIKLSGKIYEQNLVRRSGTFVLFDHVNIYVKNLYNSFGRFWNYTLSN